VDARDASLLSQPDPVAPVGGSRPSRMNRFEARHL
jgi:hypothetical protein